MNPVTDKLIAQVADPDIVALVEHWDAVEALVIRVYRAGKAAPADIAEYQSTITWLRDHHPAWRETLEPYWRAVMIKGVGPVSEDPFAGFLAVDSARAFVKNWDAMRALPAIRQATNEWLLDVIAGQSS